MTERDDCRRKSLYELMIPDGEASTTAGKHDSKWHCKQSRKLRNYHLNHKQEAEIANRKQNVAMQSHRYPSPRAVLPLGRPHSLTPPPRDQMLKQPAHGVGHFSFKSPQMVSLVFVLDAHSILIPTPSCGNHKSHQSCQCPGKGAKSLPIPR